jgi:hypothetical protein
MEGHQKKQKIESLQLVTLKRIITELENEEIEKLHVYIVDENIKRKQKIILDFMSIHLPSWLDPKLELSVCISTAGKFKGFTGNFFTEEQSCWYLDRFLWYEDCMYVENRYWYNSDYSYQIDHEYDFDNLLFVAEPRSDSKHDMTWDDYMEYAGIDSPFFSEFPFGDLVTNEMVIQMQKVFVDHGKFFNSI